MGAFTEEVKIEVSEKQAEAIGVFRFLNGLGPPDLQSVGTCRLDDPGEKSGRVDHVQRAEAAAVLARHDIDPERPGQEGSDGPTAADRMGTQDREWVAVSPVHQRVNGFGRNSRHRVSNRHHERPSLPVSRSTSALRPRSGIGSHFGRFATS